MYHDLEVASPARVVLITGCSSGIGEALSREFHKRGCKVVATARRVEGLEGLKAEGIDTEQLDVNERDDVIRVVRATLRKYCDIDILANNAGFALFKPAIELSDSELRSQLETNFVAPLALAREVMPAMKRKGRGKIVNIGSVSGVVTTPFSGAYCSSKATLHSLSDAMRMELRPFGIQVIAVQPGAVQSNFGATASSAALDALKENSLYRSVRAAIIDRAALSQQRATPAREFAQSLVEILLEETPPAIVRLGKYSRLLPALQRLLPTKYLDQVFSRRFALSSIEHRFGNDE